MVININLLKLIISNSVSSTKNNKYYIVPMLHFSYNFVKLLVRTIILITNTLIDEKLLF